MPRAPRLHVPGGCYHVTLRGNHREPLFGSAADRLKLNAIVEDAPGGFVRSVAARYSRFRHRALDPRGHLFERRYGARVVAVDHYFLAVLRYVHLNPAQAGTSSDPAAYPWSSHRAYLGTQPIEWLTTSLGLSLLDEDPNKARGIYAAFVGGDAAEPLGDINPHPRDRRILGDNARFLERDPSTLCKQWRKQRAIAR